MKLLLVILFFFALIFTSSMCEIGTFECNFETTKKTCELRNPLKCDPTWSMERKATEEACRPHLVVKNQICHSIVCKVMFHFLFFK